MEDILLKDFENKYFKGYGKGEMTEFFGISISLHSKIYNGGYTSTSPEFKKIRDYIREHYNLNLIISSSEEKLIKKYEKILETKDKKIIALQKELAKYKYKEDIKNYKQIQKCVDYLVRNGERIK